jgi:RHS repeat-associated protein
LRSATEAGTVNEAARTFQASYNELNQIAQVNGVDFTYDADGELTNDGVNTYTWDGAQRLARVTTIASGETTSYAYDGLGRRIAITAHAQSPQPVTNYYLWCDSKICQERDSGNNVTARYFAEGEAQGGVPLLYARDRLGSVVNLVDAASGAVVADYTYDPWGKVTSQSGSYSARFGYAGMFTDAGTGLDLTLYRAYSPLQNRWLSRDPMGEGVGPNLYTYVFNSPLNYFDRLGLDIWIEGPSGPEPSLHQSVNVGDPYGTYDSYSFGMNGNGLQGEVYRDRYHGGPIEEYKKTTPNLDRYVKSWLENQVHQTGVYGYDDICRSWSQRQFDSAPGTPTTPPVRKPVPHENNTPLSSRSVSETSSTMGTWTSK